MTALSKRARFEILKRDGFRCVYCGATPMDQPLQVDHVLARANGGSDDPANLVASCQPCNLGKSAVPLGQNKYAPAIATEAQEEHAEQIKKYLALQKKIAKAKRSVAEELERYWIGELGDIERTMQSRLASLLKEHSLSDLMAVVDIVAKRGISGASNQAQYFHGVLKRMKSEAPKPAGREYDSETQYISPAVKRACSLLAEQIKVARQAAVGGIPELWDLCGDPRDVMRPWLSREEMERRAAVAFGVPCGVDVLVTLRLLESGPQGFRVLSDGDLPMKGGKR